MNIRDLKIIFWGTPEFGALILNKMIINGYKPIAIVTALDQPAGRKHAIIPSPVKEVGQKNNVLILQPTKVKNNDEIKLQLKEMQPDLFIVAAYGLILPKDIIDLPKFQSINVHPSILPKHRGPSPIQATIWGGDQEAGTTLMLMDEKMDHGDIITSAKIELEHQYYKELEEQLAQISAALLIDIIPRWIKKEIKPIAQDHNQATFTKIITKDTGKIDWHKSAEEIERMVRAYWPWPSAYTIIKSQNQKLNNKIIKISQASVLKIDVNLPIGSIFLEDKKMAVKCGQNMLLLERIQLEGKKIMNDRDFLNGYPWIIGSTFS